MSPWVIYIRLMQIWTSLCLINLSEAFWQNIPPRSFSSLRCRAILVMMWHNYGQETCKDFDTPCDDNYCWKWQATLATDNYKPPISPGYSRQIGWWCSISKSVFSLVDMDTWTIMVSSSQLLVETVLVFECNFKLSQTCHGGVQSKWSSENTKGGFV